MLRQFPSLRRGQGSAPGARIAAFPASVGCSADLLGCGHSDQPYASASRSCRGPRLLRVIACRACRHESIAVRFPCPIGDLAASCRINLGITSRAVEPMRSLVDHRLSTAASVLIVQYCQVSCRRLSICDPCRIFRFATKATWAIFAASDIADRTKPAAGNADCVIIGHHTTSEARRTGGVTRVIAAPRHTPSACGWARTGTADLSARRRN